MDTLSRYTLSLQVPKQQRQTRKRKRNIDEETTWDRDPNRDKELQLGLDCFKRRFGYEKMTEVVKAINEAQIGCTIDGNWLYGALNGNKYGDPKRKMVLEFIDKGLYKRRKR